MAPNDEAISKELKAVIELTAIRTVEKALEAYDGKLADKIELHQLKCQASKLGAFKASVIGVISAAVTLIGNWLLRKI